jgi:hypothetical protein
MPFSLNLGGFSLPLEDSAGGSGGNPFNQSLNTGDSPHFNDLEIDQLGGGSLAGIIQNLGNSIPTNVGQLNNDAGYITGNPFNQSLNTTDTPTFSSLTSNGLIVSNGLGSYDTIGVGNTGTQGYGLNNTALYPDGSASFGNGGCTIDSNGNITAPNLSFDLTSDPNFSGGLSTGHEYIYATDSYGPNIHLNADGSAEFGSNGNNGGVNPHKLFINAGGDLYLGHFNSYGYDYYSSIIRADGTAAFGYFGVGIGNTFDLYGNLTVPAISVGANGNDAATNAGGIDGYGHVYCSNPVSSTNDNTADTKVEIMINGTAYYLLASTSAS